jgi:predicted acylesterase/phospholipase RssA
VLVLSSGGLKGSATLGALHCLVGLGALDLSRVEMIVGTSVGSIIGLLLALRFTPFEILELVMAKQQHLLRLTHVYTRNWYSFGAGGLVDFDIVTDILASVIEGRYGTSYTMLEVYEHFGVELVCAAYNYTRQAPVYINLQQFPDMPVLTAIKLSCAVPLVFGEAWYARELYVDGAVVSHLALEYLTAEERADAVAVALLDVPEPDAARGRDPAAGASAAAAAAAAARPGTVAMAMTLLMVMLHANHQYKMQALPVRRYVGVPLPLAQTADTAYMLSRQGLLDMFVQGTLAALAG